MRERIDIGAVLIYRRTNASFEEPSELRCMTFQWNLLFDLVELFNNCAATYAQVIDSTITSVSRLIEEVEGPLLTWVIEGVVLFRLDRQIPLELLADDPDLINISPVACSRLHIAHMELLKKEIPANNAMWGAVMSRMAFSKQHSIYFDPTPILEEDPHWQFESSISSWFNAGASRKIVHGQW